MPRLPALHMVLSNKEPMHKLTLAHLPEDLLAHVLRFTTASLRRDGHPGRPASVRHLRYATVSPAFRRAFLRHLYAVVFDHPACARLAQLNWGALRACIALRKVVVARSARLCDAQLSSLFALLSGRGIFLRDFELTLSEEVTAISLVALAEHFGPYLTRLRVVLVANPTARQRRTHSINHHTLAGTLAHFDVAHINMPGPLFPGGPPAQDEAQEAEEDQEAEEMGANELPALEDPAAVPPVPPAVGEPDAEQEANALLPVFQMMNQGGLAVNNQGWDLGNDLFAAQVNAAVQNIPANIHHASIDLAARTASRCAIGTNKGEDTSVATGDNVPIYTASNRAEDIAIEAFAKELGTHPALARNLTELLGDLTPRYDHHAGIFNPPPHLDDTLVSNQVLEKVITAIPNLVDFALIRTRFVSDDGIRALLKSRSLEKLQLCHLAKVTDSGVADVLKGLPNLRELSLAKLQGVGDDAIYALVTGASSGKFESLKLVMMDKITDPCIQFLVNGCEMLKNVTFMYCSHISSTAASHVSCSRNIESVNFCPYLLSPLSNRAVVHLSCAAVSMRALTLGNCKRIGLRAIAALANLPQLRKLHMGGLHTMSLDVMRVLGAFARLEDLLLDGQMYLSDLGVKLLCGQRGHRFIHLVLADATKSMTDEALDCIMTWCTSLRSLEVTGNFKPGVMDRLHDAIPYADVKVFAVAENIGGFLPGKRSVWD